MNFSIFASAIAAILALTSTPAQAQPATEIALALHHVGHTTSATLGCQPAHGTYPYPDQACRTLSNVDGDFGSLPHQPGLCTDIWDPVSATATGHWQGRPVSFSHTYPNACTASADSSGIFSF